MTDALAALLEAIHDGPHDDTAWLALADCLEERGEAEHGELLRLSLSLCAPISPSERGVSEPRLRELVRRGVRPFMPARTNSAGMEMVLIPPGTFLMGSPDSEAGRRDDEGPQRQVTLTRGFYLSATPVTQAQWREVMGNNPSHFDGEDNPVDSVSWHDVQALCQRLSKREGARYRLPTEAEWEHACRAGTTTPFFWGVRFEAARANARHRRGARRPGTTPVRKFPPNAWGLYDMHGNVYEWCSDWYAPYWARHVRNPRGPSGGEYSFRVLRGGCWFDGPATARSACRWHVTPDIQPTGFGCRVVRDHPAQR